MAWAWSVPRAPRCCFSWQLHCWRRRLSGRVCVHGCVADVAAAAPPRPAAGTCLRSYVVGEWVVGCLSTRACMRATAPLTRGGGERAAAHRHSVRLLLEPLWRAAAVRCGCLSILDKRVTGVCESAYLRHCPPVSANANTTTADCLSRHPFPMSLTALLRGPSPPLHADLYRGGKYLTTASKERVVCLVTLAMLLLTKGSKLQDSTTAVQLHTQAMELLDRAEQHTRNFYLTKCGTGTWRVAAVCWPRVRLCTLWGRWSASPAAFTVAASAVLVRLVTLSFVLSLSFFLSSSFFVFLSCATQSSDRAPVQGEAGGWQQPPHLWLSERPVAGGGVLRRRQPHLQRPQCIDGGDWPRRSGVHARAARLGKQRFLTI